MERLITILRAAHCRSTHQFFVLDALPLIKTDGGRMLASHLLRHYRRYLVGAKAPDKTFRDFRNHVMHVGDNYWGGAAKKSEQWYAKLVGSIRQGDWSEAAYNAGVLSHYFTDPLMPLHTAQSDRESIVHRPLEWSVTKSYDRILSRYRRGEHQVFFETSHGTGWLAEAIKQGAETANRHYDDLIGRYDLAASSKRPEEGLDEYSIDMLAGLFGLALTGWAHIVERAAIEANVDIPPASVSLSSLIATITMPVAWIVKRIESTSEQKAVRAIFAEYRDTGRVIKNLPAEVQAVYEARQRDPNATRGGDDQTVVPLAVQATSSPSKPAAKLPRMPSISDLPAIGLSLVDDLVDAPSIGPKTAKRFAKIGITNVGEFLEASPAIMAERLSTRWIKTERLVDWQDQARLVATVPGLCGYKSQLLVGVGCRDALALSHQDAENLHQRISQFVSTSAGKRILRSNRLPSAKDLKSWISNAQTVSLRRSA